MSETIVVNMEEWEALLVLSGAMIGFLLGCMCMSFIGLLIYERLN